MAFSGPVLSSTSTATAGKEYLLYVNATGTEAEPVWALVGGQRTGDLNRTADEIDASCKTNNGWKVTLAGLKSWNISLENLYLLDDDGAAFVEEAFNESERIMVKFEYADGSYMTGVCTVTECTISTPHTDVATMNCTLSGVGGLTKHNAPAATTTTETTPAETPSGGGGD